MYAHMQSVNKLASLSCKLNITVQSRSLGCVCNEATHLTYCTHMLLTVRARRDVERCIM